MSETPGNPNPSSEQHDESNRFERLAGVDDTPEVHQVSHTLGMLREQLDHLENLVAPEVRAAHSAGDHLKPVWARATEGEHRLPVAAVIGLAIVLQLVLPAHLVFRPTWLLPVLEAALALGLVIANPKRINRKSRSLRTASLALIALVSLANAWSATLLVQSLIDGTGVDGSNARALLGHGAAIYMTNIIVFGLWYWEFDRGGPIPRHLGTERHPDFLFPQYANPELAPPAWAPTFVDYLYVSFTNASAFSPTDVMPLSRWAKGIMFAQSAVSLITVALVVARAVNIFK